MKRFLILGLTVLLTACNMQATATPASTSSPTINPPPATSTLASTPTGISSPEAASSTSTPTGDLFAQSGITLPAPMCDTGLTPEDMEGPYFKAGSPETTSLVEQGMQGERLVLVGYVLDQNCQPVQNAMIDFWQADASGEYDNDGYTLRGHQFTDEQGRYYLETILPGLYGSRPIEHIHVKVQLPGGPVKTTQLYFPTQPVDNQTVTLEAREGYYVGYFNFVVAP